MSSTSKNSVPFELNQIHKELSRDASIFLAYTVDSHEGVTFLTDNCIPDSV